MQISQKTVENNTNSAINLLMFVDELQKQNESLTHKNIFLEKQVAWFKEQFKLSNQRKFGKSSETSATLNWKQLSFFDEKMSDTAENNQNTEETQKQTITYTRDKHKKKSVGRQFDVSKFPKEQKIHDLAENEKVCGCGKLFEKAGEDTSIQVDHIPETFKVIEHVTVKYCCRHCETIKSAKKPETAIAKCMATAGFVAEVITKKYEQHLPLYRQAKIFSKLGAEIPDNTLGNWVMRAAETLMPLRQALKDQLITIHVLQADETRITTLKPNKEGYFWGYNSCDINNMFILFEYSGSRSAHVPNNMLQEFSGILQTDGYSGYNDLRAKSTIISIGCWDHARRKFTDVIKIADKNKTSKAAQVLLLINQLYEVERYAKEMNFAERKIQRQEKSKYILEQIYSVAININAPPKSLLNVAVTYLLNQWPYLTEYINYGNVPISNIWIENQIRPFALGRRNWLFTGSAESANKAALLYSLIQTCNMNGISPRAYLEYALNQAPAMRRGEISPVSLLPQFIDKAVLG